jgi:hypothetical protein
MPPLPVQVLAQCHASIFLLICTPYRMRHVFVGRSTRPSVDPRQGQSTLLAPEPPPDARLCKQGLPTLPADPRFISMRSSSPAPPVNLLSPAPGQPARRLIETAYPALVCPRPCLFPCQPLLTECVTRCCSVQPSGSALALTCRCSSLHLLLVSSAGPCGHRPAHRHRAQSCCTDPPFSFCW